MSFERGAAFAHRVRFQQKQCTGSALDVSRNTSVGLEDVVIHNWRSENDSVDSIIDVKCDAFSADAFVFEISNVDFVNNSNPCGSVGFSVRNQAYVSVSMDNVVFSGNTFLRSLLFGQKNELKNTAYWRTFDLVNICRLLHRGTRTAYVSPLT